MFQFEPIEQDDNVRLGSDNLRPGIAEFKIIEAYDTDNTGAPLVSKSGNAMLKIALRLKDCKGNDGVVYDYIVNSAQWKINQLCKSLGRPAWYKEGKINTASLKGLYGQCELKEDTYNGETRMKVDKYIIREKVEAANTIESQWPDDDEIPF